MTQEVEHNGEIHEFPDEATPEMISSALGLKQTLQKNTNIPGLAGSLMQLYPYDKDTMVPFYKKEKKPPLLEYLMNQFSPKTEITPDNGVKTFMGNMPIEPVKPVMGQPESFINPERVRGIIDVLAGTPGMKIVGQPTGTEMMTGFGKDVIQKGSRQDAFNAAELEHQKAIEAEELAKNVAIEEPSVGLSSIPRLKRNAAINEQKLTDINKKLAEFPEDSALSKNAYVESEKLVKDTESDLEKYLNQGADHKLDAGAAMKNRIDRINNYWADTYKNMTDKIKNNNFDMPSIPEYQMSMDEFRNAIMKSKSKKGVRIEEYEGSPEYQRIMDHAPGEEDKDAMNFLNKYKDFRDARYNTLRDMKTATSASERTALKKAFDDTASAEKIIKQALDKGLGEYKPLFDYVNEGYSTQVFPLRGNTVARSILKTGKMSKNMIDQLTGTGEGQELLRNMAKQDPEVVRNILGQRYAKNLKSLLNPDASAQEYINENPDIQKMLDNYNKANETYLKQKDLSKISEEKSGLTKEQFETQKKLDLLSEHIANLERAFNRKNITLQEKNRLGQELDKSKSARKKLRRGITSGSLIAAGYFGIPYGIKKIAGLFGNE